MRVEIRSRVGNVVVGILGITYTLAALALLIIHGVQTWGAASTIDRAIQLLLLLVIVVAVWFVAIAARGLGVNLPRRRRARSSAPVVG